MVQFTDSDFFTVVVTGTWGHNVCNTNLVILFTVPNKLCTYMCLEFLYVMFMVLK